jgi:hypothetical protein
MHAKKLWCDAGWGGSSKCYTTCETWQAQHPSCRDLTISSDSIWSQLTGPYQQPASAAASRSVLEHDILEVSPVWLYEMESVHAWWWKQSNSNPVPLILEAYVTSCSGTLRWRMLSCLRVRMFFSTFCFDTSICIFSTCLRSHVYYIWCSCIFITVFDFRRHSRQLETKLDFKA